MTIPLDRLYNYIDNLAAAEHQGPVVIYRFWPHGSKNINDLAMLKPAGDWYTKSISPIIWCHDQEPLNFDFYSTVSREPRLDSKYRSVQKSLPEYLRETNINFDFNLFDQAILLHSEKRSHNLDQYLGPPGSHQSQLISVYYWSHAVIARDWFRYAEHEQTNKNISRRFLIYNRAWSGTREYRLKFIDLLISHDLVDHCKTFFTPTDNHVHYQQHEFANCAWKPSHQLENFLEPSQADAAYSADFDMADYDSTQIEVVLETLFDDDRLHLTEKSLRPIACGQPFILMATHGSLQYLREYGFKTFDSVWDESYDNITDPRQRMQAVIELMKTIAQWTLEQQQRNSQLIKEITNHNRQWFFGQDFMKSVMHELRENFAKGMQSIKTNPNFDKWLDNWQQHFLNHEPVVDFMNNNHDTRYPTWTQYESLKEFTKHYDPSTHIFYQSTDSSSTGT